MTRRSIITLTTDFGSDSPYVAQMKGVLLGLAPAACIVDVSHAVPAQNVLMAAVLLQDTLPWFPAGGVHIGVIDPGVGTQRSVIAAQVDQGFVVGPDNGLFSLLDLQQVVRLDRSECFQPQVSHTFHGRDIMAPVAAALLNGVPLEDLGTATTEWEKLALDPPQIEPAKIVGRVLFADSFGNLITNIRQSDWSSPPADAVFAEQTFPFVQTYGEASPGDPVALVGSSGRLELAVVNGNTARSFPSTGEVSLRF